MTDALPALALRIEIRESALTPEAALALILVRVEPPAVPTVTQLVTPCAPPPPLLPHALVAVSVTVLAVPLPALVQPPDPAAPAAPAGPTTTLNGASAHRNMHSWVAVPPPPEPAAVLEPPNGPQPGAPAPDESGV